MEEINNIDNKFDKYLSTYSLKNQKEKDDKTLEELGNYLLKIQKIFNSFPTLYEEKEYVGETLYGYYSDIFSIKEFLETLKIAESNKLDLYYG